MGERNAAKPNQQKPNANKNKQNNTNNKTTPKQPANKQKTDNKARISEAEMNRAIRILRIAHLIQVKEEDTKDPVTDYEGPASRLASSISQDVSYVKGSHTHIVVELYCSGDSDMKQASRKIGSFYIGVHARMQCADVRQEVVKLLRVASSSMTCKGKKKDCSAHVYVSLPCTGGSPLLNFCTNQVREQHTADFKELLGCSDEHFDACREYHSKVTLTFELPNRYWKLCEIKEFRNRFGLDHEGIVSCCQIGLRSVRTKRMIGKRYWVVSNNKQVTSVLHAKFARCRCSEEHATFSGKLASDRILYQEICNSLDSYCDCFSDRRSILIRRIRCLSRSLQELSIMEVLFWIACVSMLVGFGTGVVTGYLLAWWSGQGRSTPEEPICVDRGVETEGTTTTSQSFEFPHAEMASSSSFSHKVANKIGDGGSVTNLSVPFPKRLWEAQSGQDGKVFALECGQEAPTEVLRERNATGWKEVVSSGRASCIDLQLKCEP